MTLNTTQNLILAAWPNARNQRLHSHWRPVEFQAGQVINEVGQVPKVVLFPDSGLLSLVMPARDWTNVEIGVMGREGLSGAGPVLAARPALERTVVQVGGAGWTLPADVFRAEFQRDERLQHLVARHFEWMLIQAAQRALCNRLHSVEEQLSSWLLLMHGITAQSHFSVSVESIANVMGVRHSSVSLALGGLQQVAWIECTAAGITLLDMPGLKAVACECCPLLSAHLQLLQQPQTLWQDEAPIESELAGAHQDV